MNSQTTDSNCRAKIAYAIAVIGASLIVAVLVLATRHYTQPPPANANRAAERAKALAEIRAADQDALNNTGWKDKPKGIVRLKVEDAVHMVEQWHDPAVVRSNLIARAEKAYPPPPPPPPPKKSEFE